jgi:sodium-coupled neutral amino acid transporter 10
VCFAELHCASGLAFTFVKKAGVGLSLERGRGFVIAKLPGDAAAPAAAVSAAAVSVDVVAVPPWTWSAPLFINVNAGGFGVTLGYTEIDSVIVLDTPEAVHAFGKTVVEVRRPAAQPAQRR